MNFGVVSLKATGFEVAGLGAIALATHMERVCRELLI